MVWTELNQHLDSEQGHCQYVDVKCPLSCQQVLLKNQVEQHLSEACTKRPYVCRHCAFKATYEEVVDKHLPECKYIPLPCPNRCGVTCDSEDMEDHMKMCRLEEMMCKFNAIGCDGRYAREDEDLKWPVPAAVTVGLENQEDGRNVKSARLYAGLSQILSIRN